MSATLGMNRVGVQAYGEFTTIPDNYIAKLMYYLHCVSEVIQYDDITFTDYQNYHLLTVDELVGVYTLSMLLNPQLFIDAKIFIVDPELLFDNSGNQFYKITDETIGVHVNEEIMIGGKTIKVLNVMACNQNWLLKYYYTPLNAINRMILEKKKNMEYQNSVLKTETSFIPTRPINNAPINPPIVIVREFKSEPVSTICWYCKNTILTETEERFNYFACFCFLLFGILYICVQACTDKNICCCDIIHRCPRCGVILGTYKSC